MIRIATGVRLGPTGCRSSSHRPDRCRCTWSRSPSRAIAPRAALRSGSRSSACSRRRRCRARRSATPQRQASTAGTAPSPRGPPGTAAIREARRGARSSAVQPVASGSIIPAEQARLPSPPVAGCRPASVSPPQERTRQATRSTSSMASARAGVSAVAGCSRYCFFSGACSARSSFASIVS
jgi:hypothetical protein